MALRVWTRIALLATALVCGCSMPTGAEVCQVCSRPIHGELFYRVVLTDGSHRDVCCPRCGLRFQSTRDDVDSAFASDFESGRLIPAEKAHYVESSELMMCCRSEKLRRDRSGGQYALDWDRCMPSLAAFENLEDAAGFIRQRGGTLRTYSELLAEPEFSEAGKTSRPGG